MPLVILRRCLATSLLGCLVLSCAGPGYYFPSDPPLPEGVIRGPESSQFARALDMPKLFVDTRRVGATLQDATVLDLRDEGGAAQLFLRLDDAPVGQRLTQIRANLGREDVLALSTGQRIQVAFHAGPKGSQRGALVIRDQQSQPLAVIVAGHDLPEGQLPGLLQLERGRRVVYSEMRRPPDLCLVTIIHYRLVAQEGDQRWSLAPGQTKTLETSDGTFKLTVFDASTRISPPCSAQDPSHTSYLLVADPQPVSQVPM